ncbi:SigE family RNA polymerase sigma factor [Catellatospora sp. KI3]|uniref:SigE family RNA polymerase sigma factor n=1 Tax=Catellatospora sp. KI3 TaxID=3041620 RepID=UPI002482C03E|nr:SigE family RNA polymerase sigma factor [Catellatospora sp. KI3]MDI1462144.1 SigE family RNA polymerase sigma factor [Catellatospora sp. KI3]
MASWDAPTSFDEYVRSRHADLLRFAHVLCGDPHLAADLVQDALERTGLAWRRIERHDNPEGYVRRTILNCYLNGRRRLRREVLPGELPEPPGREQEPHDGELWRLLTTLPRQQRAVIVLRYYEDMSEAQIAQTLGCSQGTVKSTTSRAMAKLREALAPAGMEALR